MEHKDFPVLDFNMQDSQYHKSAGVILLILAVQPQTEQASGLIQICLKAGRLGTRRSIS